MKRSFLVFSLVVFAFTVTTDADAATRNDGAKAREADRQMNDAPTAQATTEPTLEPAEPAKTPIAGRITAEYCEAAECGSLPTGTAGTVNPYEGSESLTCKQIKVVNNDTCVARCLCNHKERLKKCNGGRSCEQTQEADYRACTYQCFIVWP